MAETDVMTVREVAEYLKVKERTIYRLVAKGGIPAFKVGGSWRFRRAEIDEWITRHRLAHGFEGFLGPDINHKGSRRNQMARSNQLANKHLIGNIGKDRA